MRAHINKYMKEESNNNKIEYVKEDGANNAETKFKKLKKKLKQAERERKEYLDGWQRERADFTNYKRDNEKYMDESRQLVREDIILQMLSVLDNLELAIAHTPEDIQKMSWYKGVEHVYKQFADKLKELGVEEIEAAGKKFDPALHEALEGTGDWVAEVAQKGYKLGDKVIRAAKVSVKSEVRSTKSETNSNGQSSNDLNGLEH